MLDNSSKKFLFLAPHTDDVELGCGGTLCKLLDDGVAAHVVAFSSCKESLNENFAENTLEKEFLASMKSIENNHLTYQLAEFPVRRFEYVRQDILDLMIEIRKSFEPDVIFLPSSNDVHQDHQVINNEGIRAFKNKTVLGYELPWNHLKSDQNLFISLEKKDLNNKIKLLDHYESQKILGRKYFKPNFVKNLAELRGLQVGEDAAESFEIIRMKI